MLFSLIKNFGIHGNKVVMEPEEYFTKHFEKNKQTNEHQTTPSKKLPNKEKALFSER